MVPAVVASVVEAITPDTAPLPDEAYRRLDYAEQRLPAQGWRAELDVTTAAAEARILGRPWRRGVTVAGYIRHDWETSDTTAGVRVGIPL